MARWNTSIRSFHGSGDSPTYCFTTKFRITTSRTYHGTSSQVTSIWTGQSHCFNLYNLANS